MVLVTLGYKLLSTPIWNPIHVVLDSESAEMRRSDV